MRKSIILTIKFLLILMFVIFIIGCSLEKTNDNFKQIWNDDYSTDFVNSSNILKSNLFYNGNYINDYSTKLNSRKDVKYEFITKDKTMLVNSPDGYIVTIPSNDVTFDYSLSAYRIQAKTIDAITTISYEKSSPYGNSLNGWNTYYNEWLNRYINNPKYLSDNNLSYLSTPSTTYFEDYEIHTYSILINDNSKIEYPYYNISILKEKNEYIKFYLFVTKSKSDYSSNHLEIVQSFKSISFFGTSSNHLGSLELIENPKWNSETKAYFDYLNLESTFDFGFFRYSLPDDTDTDYRDIYLNGALKHNEWILDNFEYEVEIQPTYTHLGWYEENHYFPTYAAKTIAGGNGFNGKPVLQFTFQFTRNNNNVSIYNTENNYTPMFDILRGYYDDYFRTLALQVKDYGKPILFRLNNEMNTDWTSYCGMMTLLDPDIYRLTWIRMYEIFDEVGVDNCIWIFNPTATSCPYSSWGEDMCYMPGTKYVQALGLTHYEMLNTDFYLSFSEAYGKQYYQKNKDVWANFPWIISEFGCASGGNSDGNLLYRNEAIQAQWVKEMFDVFANKTEYNFASKIAIAVWFNCDDIVGDGLIENALYIDPSLTQTINAFKEGFKKTN